MRCSHCGYELGAKSPPPGEYKPCPRCGSGVPSIGVEPLPPQPGQGSVSGCGGTAVNVGSVIVIVVILFALLAPGVDCGDGRRAANRSSCSNNLKQIGIALHNYHDTNRALPAQSITDETGRPMHSWRVMLLPFIEQKALYDRYDFSQPWDSEANREVREAYVYGFRCPSHEKDEARNLTNYFVVTGDDTMFGPDRWTKFSDVTDGLSNTIMVVECDSPNFRVEWSEPRDIPLDQMRFRLNQPEGISVSSEHTGGANVAFGDGSVRFLSEEHLGPATFRYLLIRNDGQDVQVP